MTEADKKTEITYTPEELREIEEIIGTVDSMLLANNSLSVSEVTKFGEKGKQDKVISRKPDDSAFSFDDFDEPDDTAGLPDNFSEGIPVSDVSDTEDLDSESEIQDITGLIRDTEDVQDSLSFSEADEELPEDITSVITDVSDDELPAAPEFFDDFTDDALSGISEQEEKSLPEENILTEDSIIPEETPAGSRVSSFDELKSLVADEPESLDEDEISGNINYDAEFDDSAVKKTSGPESADIPESEADDADMSSEIDGFQMPDEELSGGIDDAQSGMFSGISSDDEDGSGDEADSDFGFSLDDISGTDDIPVLNDDMASENADNTGGETEADDLMNLPVPEEDEESVPDFSMGEEETDDSGDMPYDSAKEDHDSEADMSDDLPEIPEPDETDTASFSPFRDDDLMAPLSAEEDDMPDDEDIRAVIAADDESEEDENGYDAAEENSSDADMELSQKDLKKLKKAIMVFSPALRKRIVDIVVNDRISGVDSRTLIDMIISGQSESIIRSFVEKVTGESVPEGQNLSSRKPLYSRPEYMLEGRERQKRRLKFLKIAGAGAAAAIILLILGFQNIYKPLMAKRLIDQGTELILRPGDYEAKNADYREAEDKAALVEKKYRKDYIYGYNRYGMAYLKKKDYQRAYSRLNKAYKTEPANMETLLNLGSFYAKIPSEFYSTVKKDTVKNYYPADETKDRTMSQLDLSINFFRRALTLDPEETRAMYGIGNAYYMLGQYAKAREFYLDILKTDDESVVGYSGLMNLYIEKDAFKEVMGLHSEILYRNLMEKLPRALLSRLAEYYLGKKKSDSFNIRVDYVVQSSKLKDADDNTLPAVRGVLSALEAVDPEYPPLMLTNARIALMEKNEKVAERYIERALDREPEFFDSLVLMGRFCYSTNQPVKSYRYLTRAMNSMGTQPEFTEEDFYRPTETPGESCAVLGNIFYYYFDRVTSRFGDLEDEPSEKENDQAANFSIAAEKYEAALKYGFSSPEIRYNLGRICYMNHHYSKALDQWLNLYDDFISSPELMLSMGNAFYHLGQYDAGKGEYLRLINVLEHEAEGIRKPDKANFRQAGIFRSLASAYNNLGAVYSLMKDETRSEISWWKAVDYAKRIEMENEFARVNLARSLGRKSRQEPVVDENIPYSIKFYSSDMR